MLIYAELSDLLNRWLKDYSTTNQTAFNTGTSPILLLSLTKTHNEPISSYFANALEIALRIDNKMLKWLNPASQLLVTTLNSKLQNQKKYSSSILFDIEESVVQAEALLDYIGLTATFGGIKEIIIAAYCDSNYYTKISNAAETLRQHHVIKQLQGVVTEYLSDFTVDPLNDPFPTYLHQYSTNIKIIVLQKLSNFADIMTKKTFTNLINQYQKFLSLSDASTPEDKEFIQTTFSQPNDYGDFIKVDSGVIEHLVSFNSHDLLEELVENDKIKKQNSNSLSLEKFYHRTNNKQVRTILEKIIGESTSFSSISNASSNSNYTSSSNSSYTSSSSSSFEQTILSEPLGSETSPDEKTQNSQKENIPPTAVNTSSLFKKRKPVESGAFTEIFLGSQEKKENKPNKFILKQEKPITFYFASKMSGSERDKKKTKLTIATNEKKCSKNKLLNLR